jgi:molybdopterin-guanine dinucleotide biosynthesis protein A
VVVAAPGQEVPPLPPNVRVVGDEVEGRGPLAGLCAGLAALEGEADAAYLSSCDVPLLTAEFVRAVLGALEEPTPRPPPCREGEKGPLLVASLGEARRVLSPSLQGGGRGVGSSSAVPFVAGRLHPLGAAYALAALPVAREHLAAGRLRMTDLLDRLSARRVEAHELPDLDSLRNVNTPDEYAAALRDLRTS